MVDLLRIVVIVILVILVVFFLGYLITNMSDFSTVGTMAFKRMGQAPVDSTGMSGTWSPARIVTELVPGLMGGLPIWTLIVAGFASAAIAAAVALILKIIFQVVK